MELTPEQIELVELAKHVPAANILKAKQALGQLVDPVWRDLHSLPYDDEPVTDDDITALREGDVAYEKGELTPHEDVLREFGLK